MVDTDDVISILVICEPLKAYDVIVSTSAGMLYDPVLPAGY